jgi:hypothetical protein
MFYQIFSAGKTFGRFFVQNPQKTHNYGNLANLANSLKMKGNPRKPPVSSPIEVIRLGLSRWVRGTLVGMGFGVEFLKNFW